MHRFAFAAALLLALSGCPSADDDDSAVVDTGEAPVLTNVTACEINNSRNTCGGGQLQLAWDITVTDVDGDLQNPQYFLLLNEQTPWLDGFFEGDLGEGGSLRLTLACDSYAPGFELPWRFAIRDAEGNESEDFSGTYTISVDPPSFGDPGVCPAQ